VYRQAELLQVIPALCTPRGFAGLLDGRQQQGNQDRNDRDHDQEFDQSKSTTTHKVRSSIEF